MYRICRLRKPKEMNAQGCSQKCTLERKGVKQISQEDARDVMRGGKDDHNIKPGPVTLASINDKTEKEIRNERVKSRGRRTEEILYITWVVMSSPRRHQMVYQTLY
jgi:hypothetical protein